MNPYYEKREHRIQVGTGNDLNFPEHLHNQIELLYVQDGEIEVTIHGEKRQMHRGDCALISPDQIHSYRTTSPNKTLIPVFDISLTGPFLHSLQKYRPACPFLIAETIPEDVHMAFNRLGIPEIQGNTALAAAWIQVILASITPLLDLQEMNQMESEDLTYRLVHYILAHYQEPLSLDILARKLHVNKYYLSHIFTEKLQMSFPRYLNRIRLEHALVSIRSSEKTLTQIWEEAGFASQRSFNRVFQAVMDMTPLEYRNSQK